MKRIHQYFNTVESSVTRMVRKLFRTKPVVDSVILARDIMAFAASSLLLSVIILLGRSSYRITRFECMIIFIPFLCAVFYNHSLSKEKIDAIKARYQQEGQPQAKLIHDIIIASVVLISGLSFIIVELLVYHSQGH